MGIYRGLAGAKRAYDFVVVGSGTAGCAAVKAILEKSPQATIAMVERGESLPNTWWYTSPLASHLLRGAQRHAGVHKGTGRSAVLGGNSALTDGPYLFGHPDEYDTISKDTACEPLQWSSVSDRIKTATSSAGVGLPDRSQYCSELNGLLEVACEAGGIMGTDIYGGGCPDGYGVKPTSAPGGVITSSFNSLIAPLMTARPNVDILTATECVGIDLLNEEATGVRVVSSGDTLSVSCGRVVLCGGCLETPTLLHSVPELAHLPIGASVAESFSVGVHFNTISRVRSKSFCIHNAHYMWRQLQEYKREGTGAFTSVSECAAFVVSNDQALVPDLRLDLFTGARHMLPAVSTGFTIDVVVTRPQTRGHISKGSNGVEYMPATSIDGFDVRVVDEGVKWATLLCDRRAELRSRSVRNGNPFGAVSAQLQTSLQTMEDVLKLMESELRPTGDVYGGCAMGSVVDSRFAVKGTKNLYVGDCSVIPGSHSGTRNAVGLVTGGIAGECAVL